MPISVIGKLIECISKYRAAKVSILNYCRVRTDLEKSLNLTLVLENSWNFKIVLFVLEFCKIALENVKLSLKIIKYTNSFPFFWIYAMRERKLCENRWIR